MNLPPTDSLAKYEACGNDYIVLVPDRLSFSLSPEAVKLLCDRHRGIGSDGVLVLRDSIGAEYGMGIINPDGGGAEFSGNGVRIFARFARDVLGEERDAFRIETDSGVIAVSIVSDEDGQTLVEAELSEVLPVEAESVRRILRLDDGREVTGYAVSVGNPHFVIFTENPEALDLAGLGRALQGHAAFPHGVNVELVTPEGGFEISLRIFERGVGETLSSGSCACAAVMVAHAIGAVGEKVLVSMPGGTLQLELGPHDKLILRGPISELMRGRFGSNLLLLLRGAGEKKSCYDDPDKMKGRAMEKFDGEEKRLYPRIPICAQVRIRGDQEKYQYHYTRDLSANGVFLISEEPLPIGTELDVDISIPFVKDLIVASGVVVRIDTYKDKLTCRHLKGFGVKFTRIADNDRDFLDRIATHLRSGFREM